MITMQLLSQVVLQHIITKIFDRPCRAILTTFKNSEVEVETKWSGDDLKIRIRKIKGQLSMDKTKKLWTPESGREELVKPKIISPIK